MQSYLATVTPVMTGVVPIYCGFQPKVAIFEMVKNSGNVNHSNGVVDQSNYTSTTWNYADASIRDTGGLTSLGGKVISLHENVGSVSTETAAADMGTGSGFFATAPHFKFRVTNVNTAQQYKITLLG